MKYLLIILTLAFYTMTYAQKETELTNEKLKFLDDGLKRFDLQLLSPDQFQINGDNILGLLKIDPFGNLAGQNIDTDSKFRLSLTSPFNGTEYQSKGGIDPAAILKLREPVFGNFGRIHMNNSFDEYWQIQARATNTGVINQLPEDVLDPEIRFYYYDTGEGNTILSIDGDDRNVSINKTEACAHLQVKQKTSSFPAFALENNGDGNDTWSYEIITDQMVLYYDNNNDCEPTILHSMWTPNSPGIGVPYDIDDPNDPDDPANGVRSGSKQPVQVFASSVMSRLKDLIPGTLTHNDDPNQTELGFDPSNVQNSFPSMVIPLENDPNIKAIDYTGFSVIAIKAIQEQQVVIEELQNQIQQLWNTINGN